MYKNIFPSFRERRKEKNRGNSSSIFNGRRDARETSKLLHSIIFLERVSDLSALRSKEIKRKERKERRVGRAREK